MTACETKKLNQDWEEEKDEERNDDPRENKTNKEKENGRHNIIESSKNLQYIFKVY